MSNVVGASAGGHSHKPDPAVSTQPRRRPRRQSFIENKMAALNDQPLAKKLNLDTGEETLLPFFTRLLYVVGYYKLPFPPTWTHQLVSLPSMRFVPNALEQRFVQYAALHMRFTLRVGLIAVILFSLVFGVVEILEQSGNQQMWTTMVMVARCVAAGITLALSVDSGIWQRWYMLIVLSFHIWWPVLTVVEKICAENIAGFETYAAETRAGIAFEDRTSGTNWESTSIGLYSVMVIAFVGRGWHAAAGALISLLVAVPLMVAPSSPCYFVDAPVDQYRTVLVLMTYFITAIAVGYFLEFQLRRKFLLCVELVRRRHITEPRGDGSGNMIHRGGGARSDVDDGGGGHESGGDDERRRDEEPAAAAASAHSATSVAPVTALPPLVPKHGSGDKAQDAQGHEPDQDDKEDKYRTTDEAAGGGNNKDDNDNDNDDNDGAVAAPVIVPVVVPLTEATLHPNNSSSNVPSHHDRLSSMGSSVFSATASGVVPSFYTNAPVTAEELIAAVSSIAKLDRWGNFVNKELRDEFKEEDGEVTQVTILRNATLLAVFGLLYFATDMIDFLRDNNRFCLNDQRVCLFYYNNRHVFAWVRWPFFIAAGVFFFLSTKWRAHHRWRDLIIGADVSYCVCYTIMDRIFMSTFNPKSHLWRCWIHIAATSTASIRTRWIGLIFSMSLYPLCNLWYQFDIKGNDVLGYLINMNMFYAACVFVAIFQRITSTLMRTEFALKAVLRRSQDAIAWIPREDNEQRKEETKEEETKEEGRTETHA